MPEIKPVPELPKKNLTIVSAVHHSDQTCLELMVIGEKSSEPYPYNLYDDDPHGDAPRLREVMAEALADGTVVVEELGPTPPGPEPEPTPEQKKIAVLEAKIEQLEKLMTRH
jgi:hypothetical protein